MPDRGRPLAIARGSYAVPPCPRIAASSSRPHLQIRRYLRGDPNPFRSVRDLGLVPARCSGESGISEIRSSRWLPAWLPVGEGLPDRLACRVRSGNEAGHNPSRRKISVRLALSPVAAACRWSLLLLSPLLSAQPRAVRWQADPDRRACRISSSGRSRPDRSWLDRRVRPVLRERRRMASNCNPNCNPQIRAGVRCLGSSRAR
jgi:hypothetical protein